MVFQSAKHFSSPKLERIEIRPSSSWRTFTQNSINLPSWISCFGALRTGKASRTTGKRFFRGRRTDINLQTNWKNSFDHWKNSLKRVEFHCASCLSSAGPTGGVWNLEFLKSRKFGPRSSHINIDRWKIISTLCVSSYYLLTIMPDSCGKTSH